MRILYDGFIYRSTVAGGIKRYFRNIVNRLPPDCVPVVTIRTDREECFPENPSQVRRYFPERVLGSPRLADMVANGVSHFRSAFERYDIHHPTYYSLLSEKPPSKQSGKLVVTVHDMIAELFRKEVDPKGDEAAMKRDAILAADAILCVSNNTKRDLMELLHIPNERITVTHLASELTEDMAHGDEAVPDQPFLLFIGSRAFYKNFIRVLLALHALDTQWPDLRLVVIGRSFNQSEREVISALGLHDRIIHFDLITDKHLAKLYRHSVALVYPSLYEGFGIPPLEAMTCGTVVVAARASSIPEVVGDAAILFDPLSVDELREAILSLQHLGSQRDARIQCGMKQAARFSWKETAAKTVAVYRQLT